MTVFFKYLRRLGHSNKSRLKKCPKVDIENDLPPDSNYFNFFFLYKFFKFMHII